MPSPARGGSVTDYDSRGDVVREIRAVKNAAGAVRYYSVTYAKVRLPERT
jgi:hypothetical protein